MNVEDAVDCDENKDVFRGLIQYVIVFVGYPRLVARQVGFHSPLHCPLILDLLAVRDRAPQVHHYFNPDS